MLLGLAHPAAQTTTGYPGFRLGTELATSSPFLRGRRVRALCEGGAAEDDSFDIIFMIKF